jgi:cytochrome c oxidase subunit 2
MNLSMRRGLGGSTLIWIVVLGVAIIAGGFLISTFTSALLPEQASGEAEQVDALFTFLMFLGGIVFLLVQGLLVFTIIRFRRRPGDDADGATFDGNPTLEVIWTAIPAFVVIVLAVYSYQVWVSIREPKPDEISIQALGQRFAWNFTYEDPLGRIPEDLPQTFNDSVLHTYVGRPVVLHLQTADVNHAFWVPTMRIKQDLLAGRTTDIRFTPTKAGRYRVVCAELCGSGHGAMYSFIQVYATEQEWMERFIDLRVDRVLNPPTDPVALGFNILSSGGSSRVDSAYPCAGCHVNDNLGWAGVTGPTLNGIGDTAVRRAVSSGLGTPEAYIANSIRHPNQYVAPGYQAGVMPQFGPDEEAPAQIEGPYYVHMPDEDLIEIVSYLCTQSATGESTCGDIESITAAVEAQR